MTDLLQRLLDGFAVALSPEHLAWSAAGVTLGTLVGVLPGFGPALTIALLLPLTWHIDAGSALMLFAGIYYGAMYGGSTSAILLNVPGESATVVTAIEGHAMSQAGRAGAALTTAAIGSFVAGTLGTVGITLLAEPVIALALRFGPAEYCVLMLIVMITVTDVFGASRLRACASLWVGLGLGLVGLDLQSGVPRLTFGHVGLFEGIDVVIVAMGLFAIGETLHRALRADTGESSGPTLAVIGRLGMTRLEWRLSGPAWLRGALIGFPLGALPAGGAELPTFISYGLERRLARRGTPFGAGAIAGVAGPEAANNAAAAGVLVPLLALGLPTSA
ncbi:MAG: tripartite tricarboxylate transporter permease, partial [Gammaproteobacteria bacterium]